MKRKLSLLTLLLLLLLSSCALEFKPEYTPGPTYAPGIVRTPTPWDRGRKSVWLVGRRRLPVKLRQLAIDLVPGGLLLDEGVTKWPHLGIVVKDASVELNELRGIDDGWQR